MRIIARTAVKQVMSRKGLRRNVSNAIITVLIARREWFFRHGIVYMNAVRISSLLKMSAITHLETADVLVSNISVESIVRLMTEFAILDLEEMIVRMEVHLLGRREIASVSVLWDGRTIIVSRRGSVRTSQLGFTVVFMVT